jgi:hypothetical protein
MEVSQLLCRKLTSLDLRRKVCSFLVGGMTYKDACERRLALMSERGSMVKHQYGYGREETFFERHFSLCEH